MSINLKIVVCGPKSVGKSTICNGICDYNNPIPEDYRPTRSIRILETEQEIKDDHIKQNDNLKGKNKCNIQLWDMGGDRSIEKLWPIIRNKAHGAILVIDAKSKHDNFIDEWINSFCHPDISVDNCVVIAYNKDNVKSDKQKTSNQFPKLTIFETNYDLNNILPIFHQFVDKLIAIYK